MAAEVALSLVLLALTTGVPGAVSAPSTEDSTNLVDYVVIKETEPPGRVLLSINESSSRPVWTVTRNGTDLGAVYRYFNLTEGHGVYRLVLQTTLDLEVLSAQGVYPYSRLTLSVSWKDKQNENQFRRVIVEVHPVNEFAPVFLKAPYNISVPEDKRVDSEVFLLSDKTLDMDAGVSRLAYAIEPYTISEFDGRHLFAIKDAKGGSVVLRRALDFEYLRYSIGRYNFFLNVTVTDEGGMASSTSIQIFVTDVNDQGVEFLIPDCEAPCEEAAYEASVNESYVGPVMVEPVPIRAWDLDTLNSSIQYSLVPGPFVDSFRVLETGQLVKVKQLDNSSSDYLIYLQVVARETINWNHRAVANVTVFVEDRVELKSMQPVDGVTLT